MEVSISENEQSSSVKGEERQVKCKGCNRELGILFITPKPLLRNGKSFSMKSKFICPCGDSSFAFISENVNYFIPDELLEYESFALDCGTNVAKMKEKK